MPVRALSGHRIFPPAATPILWGTSMDFAGPCAVLVMASGSVFGGILAVGTASTQTGWTATLLGLIGAGSGVYLMWSRQAILRRQVDAELERREMELRAEIEEKQQLIQSLRDSKTYLQTAMAELRMENEKLRRRLEGRHGPG